MAEHAAHLTNTTSNKRPSIFEILAQDSLNRVIQPAVKRAVRVFAEQFPDKYGWLITYFNEIYACLDLFIQNYYLYRYGGSFTEQFYGIKRITNSEKTLKHLPKNVHLKSLLFLVIVPYVREKWKLSYEYFKESQHQHTPSIYRQIRIHPMKTALLSVFPHINGLWEFFILLFELGYIFQHTNWSSPDHYFAGVQLVADSEGNDVFSKADSKKTNFQLLFCSNFFTSFMNLLKYLFKITSFGLSTGLSVAVFFLQFLDYWYNTQNKMNSPVALTALPIPPKPVKLKLPAGCSYSTCPLCKKTRTNDTVLSVTGFVFCYPCIYDYVSEYKCCPITKYPSNIQHLVRIYSSE
ncbi:peroxisome assembly protein 12 [Octopus sinensis]|uniref:Peroxisome assembly protein 12 n=1 Tax=Octopus sinensis TaxID=2607531 RepID=A0A6P7TGN2_9MOLL|nr:peroxisome assembly protein 12 [Octopus sinensis]